MEEPEKIVPEGALVACPERGGVVSVRDTCQKCEKHQGIGVLNDHPAVPWHEGHRVLCGLPRKIGIIPKVD